MKKSIFSIFFVSLLLFATSGCKDDTLMIPELQDAKKLAKAIRSKGNYFLSKEDGFTIDSTYDYYLSPMVIDAQGVLQKGGLFKFINRENHQVTIEATDINEFTIKVDLDANKIFGVDETIIYKFDPSLDRKKEELYSHKLKTLLNFTVENSGYVSDDEKIEIDIYLHIIKPIFPTAHLSATFGSPEYLQEIKKEKIEREKRKKIYAQIKKETVEAFIQKNNIPKNESISYAIDNTRAGFTINLTKNEIEKLAQTNEKNISRMSLNYGIGPYGSIHDKEMPNVILMEGVGSFNKDITIKEVISSQDDFDTFEANLNGFANRWIKAIKKNNIDFEKNNLFIYTIHQSSICRYEIIENLKDKKVEITFKITRKACASSFIDYFLVYKVSKDVETIEVKAFRLNPVTIENVSQ